MIAAVNKVWSLSTWHPGPVSTGHLSTIRECFVWVLLMVPSEPMISLHPLGMQNLKFAYPTLPGYHRARELLVLMEASELYQFEITTQRTVIASHIS